MSKITYSRWRDNYGEDPIDRVSIAPAPARGRQPVVVIVDHVPQPAPVFRPNWSERGSNGPPTPTTTTTVTVAPARVASQDSGVAPFETLFTQYHLVAVPYYNFWEKDEESSINERGNQNPDDLPRYVHLSWDPAPDLKDPDEFRKRALLGQDPNAKTFFTQLSPFGFGSHEVVSHVAGGLPFTPEHLQPSHFEQNAKQVANGHVFSGIAETVVSVATASIVPPPAPTPHLVDEDEFLADYRRWWGIPFGEYNAALWRRKSSIYGTQQTLRRLNLSPAGATEYNLFSGQFGIAPPDGNSVALRSINPNGPSISYSGAAAVSSRGYSTPRIYELGEQLLAPTPAPSVQSMRAKLIHTNFLGLMDTSRINSITAAHHGEAIAALAPLAGNLAAYSAAGAQHYARQISIPSFRAPNTIKPLEYIGYVIEKWEQVDGTYQLADTIYVPGREYTDYIDAGVKYGVSYRYRIKGILRWSREHGLSIMGKDPTVIDPPGASINSLAPNDVSYFASEWDHDWAYSHVIDTSPPNPPDELIVQPHSEPDPSTGRPYVVVSFKLPYNPQRDINKMTLYRKIQDADGYDVTGWVRLHEFKEDLDDPTRQGTLHLYETSYQHEQDDITGTKFKASETERVETLVEYGPANGRFEDHDVEYYGKGTSYRYVYAAMCFTRHGEESVLSDQLGCRLNPEWKKAGELPIDFVSCAGVSIDYDTGLFSTYPEQRLRSEIVFRPDIKHGVPGSVSVLGQERRAKKMISDAKYVMRVESLDTGQHVDVPLNVKIQNFPEKVSTLPLSALVSAQR